MYRRLARINAGVSLAAQRDWLQATFVKAAESADEGGVKVQNQNFEGSGASFLYDGATSLERSEALDDALTQLDELIAEEMPRSAPGMLTPVFPSGYIPR